jgi:hypothetical protein
MCFYTKNVEGKMKRLNLVLLLMLTIAAFGDAVSAQSDAVVIYNDFNFQGASQVLRDSWRGGGDFDRNVRSIRVPAGYRVTIYTERNFRGTESALTEDWNTNSATAYWVGKIRSIRVERGGGQSDPNSFPTARGDDMLPNEKLGFNQTISSRRGDYRLIFQNDGNLVLYRGSKNSPVWSSNTANAGGTVAVMQNDGNLVIYGANQTPIWSTNTNGSGGTRLIVQDDGNVVIYRPDNVAVWSANTNQEQTNPPAAGNFPVIYAERDYNGPALAIERDFEGNRDWNGNPHRIRSIRVPQGWYLVVYERQNYRGRSYNVNFDWSPTPDDFWYGKIRSIRVYQGAPPRQPR